MLPFLFQTANITKFSINQPANSFVGYKYRDLPEPFQQFVRFQEIFIDRKNNFLNLHAWKMRMCFIC